MRRILRNSPRCLARGNRFLLRNVGAVIVLGESQRDIFKDVVVAEKIKCVPNFAADFLFISQRALDKKFDSNRNVQFLFLSNLLSGKGYQELLDAYLGLDECTRAHTTLHFAGAFGSAESERRFLAQIKGHINITYHGVVLGDVKRQLFHEAQVFCLPTYYAFEGQPISILEAYASGCAVITTNHSGICDIFRHEVNGYEVKVRSANAVEGALRRALRNPAELHEIGLRNRRIAETEYRERKYSDSVWEIIARCPC